MKQVMKMSALYAPTLKETPAEAELVSHQLMLRAGMIRRLAAGVYSYLPLAWRSLLKIEQIVREEMDAIGASECLLPILTPAELWHESGRWDDYGPELMRIADRHDRMFCLGPTHEETVTALIRDELRSYKQLPVTLYQFQTKFRDEIRPRFGLMRGREFIMKDAYSFNANEESLDETFEDMRRAYGKICERCELAYREVEADSGQIGGSGSIEFMALADAGEAELVWCDCGYAADVEAATTGAEITFCEAPSMEKVATPGVSTIEGLAEFLGIPENGTVKALALIDGEGQAVVAFVPGTHELNDVKAEKAFGAYHMMTDEEIDSYKLAKGSMGPVGLPEGIKVVADVTLKDARKWICGANEHGYHVIGAEMGVDFAEPEFVDLVSAREGDLCPVCGKPLHAARGIEVSQIFKFGDKYSRPLNATYMDENGREQYFVGGSYGVGISRTMAAVLEQHYDENGIVWPVSVAPFEVSVVPLDPKDEGCMSVASQISAALAGLDIDVVVDDRDERPGVKFADNDLMGFPYQVVLGKRGLKNGTVEIKDRRTGERKDVPVPDAAELVAGWVKERRL